MANQINDDNFDDDDIDSKPWPQDNDGFDDMDNDMDGDFDDKGFDDFNNAPDNRNGAAPKKKSPLLIMGGAVLAIALVSGYLAKDILTGSNSMQSAPDIAQNTPPDPFTANNTLPPPSINTDAAAPPAVAGQPDFNAYDAETAGTIIGDNAFAPDTTAGNTDMPEYAGDDMPGGTEDPFGNVAAGNVADNSMDAAVSPNTPDFAAQEENSITIPFSNESAPDAVAATVIEVEDIPLENLTANNNDPAPQDMSPDIPASGNPANAATNDIIASAFEQDNAGTFETPDTVAIDTAADDSVPFPPAGAQQDTVADLKRQVEALMAERTILQNTIEQQNSEIGRLKARNETAPVMTDTGPEPENASAETAFLPASDKNPVTRSYAPANPPPPSAKPALVKPQAKSFMASSSWVLRAASAQEAYISKRGDDELIHVKTGDAIPGMGTVKAIAYTPNGWQVLTDSGVIGQ